MYDRHRKADDAHAVMHAVKALDNNKSEVPKESSGSIKEITKGKMCAEIYAQGEALIQVRHTRVPLEPGELRALYGLFSSLD